MAKRKGNPSSGKTCGECPKRHKRQGSVTSTTSQDFIPDIDVIWDHAPAKSRAKPDRVVSIPMDLDSQPLPSCKGPKTKPFACGKVDVQFIREIGDNAMHSNVFEVRIRNKLYALKLFKTFPHGLFPKTRDWDGKGLLPKPSHAAKYFRPFERECRAYGRIQESAAEDRFWKCYGYLRVPADMRKELYDATGVPAHYWQVRPLFDGEREDKPSGSRPWELDWPIYGLVKELAPTDALPVDPMRRSVRLMLSDLKQLHKMEIVNYDIADRNYIAGRLVDFSSSYTLPHIWFEAPKSRFAVNWPSTFQHCMNMDSFSLVIVIRESGVKTKAITPYVYASNHVERTRAARARVQKIHGDPKPFYELGAREPSPTPPPKPDGYEYS